MLSDFFSKSTASGHPPDMLSVASHETPITDMALFAAQVCSALFHHEEVRPSDLLADSGAVRMLDISSAKVKAKTLYDAIRAAVLFDQGLEPTVFDALPSDICSEIYRNAIALNYAHDCTDIYLDTAGSASHPMIHNAACDIAAPTYADRYVISTCTAINRTLLSISLDKDYGEPHMQLVIPLMAKPVPGWLEDDFFGMLKAYASSEFQLYRHIITLSGHQQFYSAVFTNPDTLFSKLMFGGNALYSAVSRLNDLPMECAGILVSRLFSQTSLLRAMMRAIIAKCIASEIAASVNAVDTEGLDLAEPKLPNSFLYDDIIDATETRSAHAFGAISNIYSTCSFARYTQDLKGKYRESGFPKQIYMFSVRGAGNASVPVLFGYDAETLVNVALIPSTEHAAAMLRAMYGMPKSSSLEVHSPSQEMLLSYADPGFSGRLVAKALSAGTQLAYVGLKDIRPYLVKDAEPRQPGDCPPDELFHVFA